MADPIWHRAIFTPKTPIAADTPTDEMVALMKMHSEVSAEPIATPKGLNMSKLSELAANIATAQKEVEADAEKALTRLTAAKDNAKVSIGKIDGISAGIEQSTKDIENFTNQLTNGGPL